MILCICQRGAVRSATLAIVLRDCYGKQDVISTGLETTTPDEMRSLICHVKQIYICADDDIYNRFIAAYQDALLHNGLVPINVNVGVDRWMCTMHPGLVQVIVNKLEEIHTQPDAYLYGSPQNYIFAHAAAFYRQAGNMELAPRGEVHVQ